MYKRGEAGRGSLEFAVLSKVVKSAHLRRRYQSKKTKEVRMAPEGHGRVGRGGSKRGHGVEAWREDLGLGSSLSPTLGAW